MAAGVYNFAHVGKRRSACEQGATFERRLTWKQQVGTTQVPMDLSGYTARMQVRKDHKSATPLIELTTENGCITLGGTTGVIELLLQATQTATLPAGSFVYDIELVSSSGKVYRILEGEFQVTPEVTR